MGGWRKTTIMKVARRQINQMTKEKERISYSFTDNDGSIVTIEVIRVTNKLATQNIDCDQFSFAQQVPTFEA